MDLVEIFEVIFGAGFIILALISAADRFSAAYFTPKR